MRNEIRLFLRGIIFFLSDGWMGVEATTGGKISGFKFVRTRVRRGLGLNRGVVYGDGTKY